MSSFFNRILQDSSLKISQWRLWGLAVFIGLSAFLISNNVADTLIRLIGSFLINDANEFIVQNIHWIGLFQNLLMIVVAVLIAFVFSKTLNINNLGFKQKPVIQSLSIAVVFGFAIQLLYFVLQNIQKLTGTAQEGADGSEAFLALGFGQSLEKDIATAVLIGCAAPIAEEFIYRGVILRILRDSLAGFKEITIRVASISALLISALLFAGIHGGAGQADQFWGFVLMAVIFGMAYFYSGSLKVVVLTHSISNVIAGLMGFIQLRDTVNVSVGSYIALLLMPVLAWFVMILFERYMPLVIRKNSRTVSVVVLVIFFLIGFVSPILLMFKQ